MSYKTEVFTTTVISKTEVDVHGLVHCDAVNKGKQEVLIQYLRCNIG